MIILVNKIDKTDKTSKLDKISLAQRKLLREHAAQLADVLSECPEYINFVNARRRLEENQEYAEFLNEMRRQQIVVRLSGILGEDAAEDSIEFDSMYSLMADEPLISEYLFAEYRFLRLISDVENVFSSKLSLWDENPQLGYDIRKDINYN